MTRLINNRLLGHAGIVMVLILLLIEGAPLRANAQTTPGTATVLVMDISSSMNDADASGLRKIDGAKKAGLMVVNAIGEENSLGAIVHQAALVTFNETAQVAISLTTDTSALANRVQAMSPSGNTNIGDGLDKALTLLQSTPGSTQKIIILLSDGLPNTGLRQPAEFQSGPVARARGLGACIYAVGFGTGGQMNADLLRAIAEGTGCGKFYLAAEAFELVSTYMRLRHESTGQNTQTWTGVIGQGEEKQLGAYPVEPNQELLDLSLVWPGSKVELVLRDPKNTIVTPSYPGAQIFSGPASQRILVQNPAVGNWNVGVRGVDVPEKSAPFRVAASVRPRPPQLITPTLAPTATATATATPRPTWTPLPTATVAPSPTPAPTPMSSGGGSGVGLLMLGAVAIGGMSGAVFLARRRRMMHSAWLQVAGGPHAGYRIALRQMPFRIGRALDNDWVLSDETVSRHHAVIYWSGREFFVKDLDSLGGTYVNARPVTHSVLRPGDHLRIGAIDLVFMQGGRP